MSEIKQIIGQVDGIVQNLQWVNEQAIEYKKYIDNSMSLIIDSFGTESQTMQEWLMALNKAKAEIDTMIEQIDAAIEAAKEWMENTQKSIGAKVLTNNGGGRSK